MNEIEKLVMELAGKCRKSKLNFVIVVEDNGVIHDNHSINKNHSALSGLVDALKLITK